MHRIIRVKENTLIACGLIVLVLIVTLIAFSSWLIGNEKNYGSYKSATLDSVTENYRPTVVRYEYSLVPIADQSIRALDYAEQLIEAFKPVLIISVDDELPSLFYNTSLKPYTLVHIVRERSFIAIQYWYYYITNIHPLSVHEDDWEVVIVLIHINTDSTYKPLLVFYGIHGTLYSYKWDEVVTITSRPLVYVAYGSHANYPCPPESCQTLWSVHLDRLNSPTRELMNYSHVLIDKLLCLNEQPLPYGHETGSSCINLSQYTFNIKPPWQREIWNKLFDTKYS